MALVGREAELAQLAGALQRGAEGGTSRLALAGPAGIGSTELLTELENRMSGLPGLVVARGRADAPRSGVPYHALAQALDGALSRTADEELAEVVEGAGHDLVVLLPALARRLDALAIDHQVPQLEAEEQRGSRMAESVLGLLERLGRRGVVLLALEDLHWADPATRNFVAALLRVSRPLPLALVVTYQPDALHRRHPMLPLARALTEDRDVRTLVLEPLGRDELAALVEKVLGEPVSGSLLAAVMEGSRGNPLYATQLAIASSTLEGVRLSDPFDQVLGARLDALSDDAVRVVRLLAAARRPLARERISGPLSEGGTTPRGIAEAMESGLVSGGHELSISHELYAEAIEDLELPPERHALHALLARLSDTPGTAAWHWQRASRPTEARESHLRAAADAQRADPGATTLDQYQQALEVGEDGIGGAELGLADLLERAAHAAATAGEFRRAAALMKRSIDQRVSRSAEGSPVRPATRVQAGAGPRDAALRRSLGASTVELGRYLWASGDLIGGVDAMERALSLMPTEPTETRARALASLAQHLMIDGRFEESARLAQEARAVAREAGERARPELGHATCTLGVDVAYQGEVDRGLALLEEATEIARAEGRLDDLERAYANRTTVLDLDSRREAALAVVKDGIRDAAAGGLSATYGAFLRGNAADILFQLGRWREAELECRAAMEWPPSGVAWFSPTLYLGLVLVESRTDDEAARLVGQTLLQLETVPAGQWTALVQRAAVSLALWRGDTSDAVAVADREWERVLETEDVSQICLAASTTLEAAAAATDESRAARAWSDVATAGELAQRVLPEAERRLAASSLPPSVGARREATLNLETARAHLLRIRGRATAETWNRLAQSWAEIPMPYQQAKARWWQALAALQGGEARPVARRALQESWRIGVQLGARPLLRALLDLSSRARMPLPEADALDLLAPSTDGAAPRGLVPVGPGVPGGARSDTARAIAERVQRDTAEQAPSFGLSPREQEVLEVLVEGRTNREIAERLFISERTVAVHVRRILAKLSVSGRTEAAGLAIRLQLVPEVPATGRAGQAGNPRR